MDNKKLDAILREIDAFQAAAETIGAAKDPVVHQYLQNLNALINSIRSILRQ